MANLLYVVRKGKNKLSNVYLRFYTANKELDVTINTGYKVVFDNWSKSKQKVKNIFDDLSKDEVNNALDELKKFIFKEYNKALSEKITLDKYWVKKVVDLRHNRIDIKNEGEKVYLTDYAKKFIEDARFAINTRTQKQVAKSTLVSYQNTLNILLNYEKENTIKIKFSELNKEYYDKFVRRSIEGLMHSNNTIAKSIKNTLVFARNAIKAGIIVNPAVNEGIFIKPASKTYETYLTESEIFKIYSLDLSNNQRLNNVRNLFIIGLWTGLRISDFSKLKEENFIGDYIQIDTKKGGVEVIIPIHKQIKTVLEKSKGLPKVISNQKFNLYIKEVVKLAGINEIIKGSLNNPKTKRKEKGYFEKHKLIGSHTCRRSFASNLYGKLPNQTIMAITGHKSEEQFLRYIKITSKEHAETVKALWEKMYKEQWNKTQLKVV